MHTWEPPPGISADTGWRDSEGTLCAPHVGVPVPTGQVVAHPNGVIVIAAVENNPFAGDPTYTSNGYTVQFNDGSGWRQLYHSPNDHVAAIPARQPADVPVTDIWLTERYCQFRRVDLAGTTECLSPAPLAGSNAASAMRLGADTAAYIIRPSDAQGVPLRRFTVGAGDDSLWADLETLLTQPAAFWTDALTIVVANQDELVRREPGGETSRVDLPEPVSGAFGRPILLAPDDVWVHDLQESLWHFDGEAWEPFTIPPSTCRNSGGGSDIIRSVHAGGGVLWVMRHHALYRVEAGVTVTVLDWDCDAPSMIGLAGTADGGEAYIVLHEPAFERYACGASFVLWSDGVTTQRF